MKLGNEHIVKEKFMSGPASEFDRNQARLEPTKERPYVYELYAVLIHRGSAMGGHYYAFIKVFYIFFYNLEASHLIKRNGLNLMIQLFQRYPWKSWKKGLCSM